MTARTGAGGPAVQETLSVLQRANATFVRVPAMSDSAVADMVQDAVRANADESLLNLAVKAQGNPFLIRELVGGLVEEGRLNVSGGRAMATGHDLPRRLCSCMQQRLGLLSDEASEAVRVAAVLPARFSAGLLAAMLERQPASLMSALAETVRAGLLVDDGEQLRFSHDLLREATRQCLPQSLRRAMERQSASIMLSRGAAPAEVATQLVRSAEHGDREAITALRQAARTVSQSDASAAADLSKRALELMRADDAEQGRVVAETVALLNRARRYKESEELALAALSKASGEEEAEIRLRLPAFTSHTTQRRVEESRRALELTGLSEVTRARHLALLAYNLMLDDKDGQHRAAAEEAADTAESIGDLESKVIANLTLTSFDCADGYACRALHNMEELCALGATNDLPVAHLLATNYYANLLALVGRLDEAADQVTAGTERARQERNAMVLDVWATIDGMVHLLAGRLTEARAAVESLQPPEHTGVTELDMVRIVILAQVAVSTDDRTLLQQTVADAHEAYSSGASMVRRTAAYVLALAAWYRNDHDDAERWFGGDIDLFGTPLTPQALDQVILARGLPPPRAMPALRARPARRDRSCSVMSLRSRLFARSPNMSAGYSKAMLRRWSLPRACLRRRRGRCSTPRRRKMLAANSSSPIAGTRRLITSMRHSTPTRASGRSPTRAGWAASCADWASNGASSASRGRRRVGTVSPIRSSRSSTSSRGARPIAPPPTSCTCLSTRLKPTCTTHLANSTSVRGAQLAQAMH